MKILLIILQLYLCDGIWRNKPCHDPAIATPDPIQDEANALTNEKEAILIEVTSEAKKLVKYRISTALQVAEVKDNCLGKNTIATCRKVALKVIKELQMQLFKAQRAEREEERLRIQRAKVSRPAKR